MLHQFKRAALLSGLAIAVAGCDTGTDPALGAETEVLLARGAVASQSIASELVGADPALSRAAAAGPVALGNVASITMLVTRVDALPAAADTADEAAWVSLDVTAGGEIDLLALPEAAAGGLTLARGELPAGTYSSVRLFIEDPTITLLEPVTAGQRTYPAGEAIPLFVPSAAQSGLKTAISFTVEEGDAPDVLLVFDADASVDRIIATGAGTLILPPVVGARTELD